MTNDVFKINIKKSILLNTEVTNDFYLRSQRR